MSATMFKFRELHASPAMRAAARKTLPAAPSAAAAKEPEPSPPTPIVVVASARPRRCRAVFDERVDAGREVFPAVFLTPRPPLAVGISDQITAVAGDEIDRLALGRFMAWWVSRTDYLDAVAHGEPRRNLDGSVAGEPTEAQRRDAAQRVYGARAEKVLARIAARQHSSAPPGTPGRSHEQNSQDFCGGPPLIPPGNPGGRIMVNVPEGWRFLRLGRRRRTAVAAGISSAADAMQEGRPSNTASIRFRPKGDLASRRR